MGYTKNWRDMFCNTEQHSNEPKLLHLLCIAIYQSYFLHALLSFISSDTGAEVTLLFVILIT